MDNDNKKSGRLPIASIAVLACAAALVCALSLYIVWYGDALLYQFNFETAAPLRGLADIPVSQCWHYIEANGRIVAHSIVQVFCGITGQTSFAVCNALAYVCLILLLLKYAGADWRAWPETLAATLLVLFFCDTSYIPPHQIGYIWMSCTAILFLIVYDRQDGRRAGWGTCVGLLLLGLVCGNGNEAINLGIGTAIGIDMLRNPRRYPLRRWMLLIGFCTGVAVLCLSPAVMDRPGSMYRPPLVLSLFNMVTSLRAFWVFALLLVVSCMRHKVELRRFVADNRLMFTAMIVMLIFNIVITVKGNRQLYGVELYSVVLTLRLLRYIKLSALWLTVAALVVAGQYYMKFTTLAVFNADETELRRQLTQHGNAPLYIDLTHHNPYVHPIEELSYHDCVNLTFHVATIADDIHQRGSFYTRHIYNPMDFIDSVALYPTALAEIETLQPRNRVVDCGNGVYMMLRLKSNPARFTLHRSLDIPGFRMTLPPVEISFDASQHPSTDIYDVFVTSFPYPLMRADSVTVSF